MNNKERAQKGIFIVSKLLSFILIAALLILTGCDFANNDIERKKNRQHKIPDWPPLYAEVYPSMKLIDQNGGVIQVSDFDGKVVVIEYIGMDCPACQALCGANEVGAYENASVQRGLKSFKEICANHSSGVDLDHDDLVYIQILLYDIEREAPTPIDAAKWAEHFGFHVENGVYVTVPTKDMRNDASYKLIPGFQLLDRKQIMRSDSTGHHPRHDLMKHLIPETSSLLGTP